MGDPDRPTTPPPAGERPSAPVFADAHGPIGRALAALQAALATSLGRVAREVLDVAHAAALRLAHESYYEGKDRQLYESHALATAYLALVLEALRADLDRRAPGLGVVVPVPTLAALVDELRLRAVDLTPDEVAGLAARLGLALDRSR